MNKRLFLVWGVTALIGVPSPPGMALPLPIKVNSSALEKKAPASERWTKWLDEVKPIMTSMELSVFRQLQTEEDRTRFQGMFWKARDPNTPSPQSENEYKREFYQRLRIAEQKYGGGGSDQGRIYIILGKPSAVEDYSGFQTLVDCQLWVYHNENRPGLLPVVNLIFFRPRNLGNYSLFYPGIHTARDLLEPNLSSTTTSSSLAYEYVGSSSSELAQASLSVIPGEGDPSLGFGSSSSNFAFSQIFSFPGTEVRGGYLTGFNVPQGLVQTSSSTLEIMGWGNTALSVEKNITFLNIAVMPAGVRMTAGPNERYRADLRMYIQIEDPQGNAIYQDERKIAFNLSAAQKKDIDDKRVIFRDFVPMIPGDFLARITLINTDFDEFYTYEEKVTIPANPLPVLTGFKINEIRDDGFVSFALGKFLLFNDPRCLFNPSDTLEGIVLTDSRPEISLSGPDGNPILFPDENLKRLDNGYRFSRPLAGLAAGKYLLSVKADDGRSFSQNINLAPSDPPIPKPMAFEKTEPASAGDNFRFLLAQEYLNGGQLEKALALLRRLPEALINSTTLPVLGRAQYLNRDYAGALATLEKEQVEKNYAVLLMLANAAIELKEFRKAVDYLEKIRKYHDSLEINYSLAASYLSLGEKDQAKVYLDHIRELEKKK